MKKNLISLLLALSLIISLAVPASAESNATDLGVLVDSYVEQVVGDDGDIYIIETEVYRGETSVQDIARGVTRQTVPYTFTKNITAFAGMLTVAKMTNKFDVVYNHSTDYYLLHKSSTFSNVATGYSFSYTVSGNKTRHVTIKASSPQGSLNESLEYYAECSDSSWNIYEG